ncbi:hypothetical protein AC15_3025 [Escherichia coli 2-156-04_S3_C2]|nr:hypothetical protein ECSTEC7V_3283 [Escherichia coli STEC_7v]KDA57053.1 hypothetical protein AA98_3078 [Escherichia coli 2-011-08_S1_C1]KDW29933.1 hypothetical protein AC15_3025 [Escherichia coli 2-156-04_S3_C2]
MADCPCASSGKNIQVTGFTNIKNEQLTLLLNQYQLFMIL